MHDVFIGTDLRAVDCQVNSSNRLEEVARRYGNRLAVQFFFLPEPTGSEWKCSCSVNGIVRATVGGKTSRYDAKEAVAEAALAYLQQQGYE
jgi:hypothetical protein